MTRKSKKSHNKLAYAIPKCKYDALWARTGSGYHKYVYKDAREAGKCADMMKEIREIKND